MRRISTHREPVHERQGHEKEDHDRGYEEPEHTVAPVGNISPTPEESGEEEGDEEGAEGVDVQAADGTDIRIQCDEVADERAPGNEEVVDPRNMKRDGSPKQRGEGEGFVDAISKKMKHSLDHRLKGNCEKRGEADGD